MLGSVALGALALWATLPLGGVSPWAADSILLAALAVSILLLLLRNDRPTSAGSGPRRAPLEGMRWWWLAMLALPVWALLQMVALPAAWVVKLQPGWGLLLGGMSAVPERLSLAVDRGESFYALGLWIALAGVAAATAACFRDRHAARLLAHVTAGLGVFQAFAALMIPGLQSSWWAGFADQRLRGTFPGPNTFGGFLVLTVPVTLGLLLTLFIRLLDAAGGRWKRLLTLPAQYHGLFIETAWVFLSLLAQMVTLIGSGSRGAVLATLIPVLVLFFGYLVALRGSRQAALQLAGLLLLAVMAVATGGGLYLLLQRFEADSLWVHGVPYRLAIWGAALRLIGAFPLGVGAGAFPRMLPMMQPPVFGGYRLDHAHNDYLQSIGEFGVPGMLLLVMVLAGLLMRAAGTVRLKGAHASVWIWRGAAAAVVAALAHAVVDFNLTARPGVQVLFFIVCGLMLAAPRKGSETDDEPDSRRSRGAASAAGPETSDVAVGLRQSVEAQVRRRPHRVHWRPPALLVLVLPLSLMMAFPVVGRLIALRQVEGAHAALDLPADRYFWTPPPWVPPARALAVLAEAVESRPRDWRFRASLAAGYLARLEQERRAAIAAAREDEEILGAADLRRIESVVDLAMGWDWQQAWEVACRHAEQAIDLAPWNADIRSLAGNLRARLAVQAGATPAGAAHRQAVLVHIESALRLAPFDVVVLEDGCRALARLRVASLATQDTVTADIADRKLAEAGQLAIRLDAQSTMTVLSAWEDAGMSVERMADLEDQTVPVLREIYRHFDRTSNSAGALRVLDRLANVAEADHLRMEEWSRLWLEWERYRWWLRDGDWTVYRAAWAQRRELWRRRQGQALGDGADTAVSKSDLAYRLRLREVDYRMGLTVLNLLALAQIESDRSAEDAVMDLLSRALALGWGLPDSDPEEAALASVWVTRLSSAGNHYVPRWLEARRMLSGGQARTAAVRYARLLEHPRLPLRFRHRIMLEAALARAQAGEPAQALAIVEAALQAAATDPDVLQAWIAHGRGDEPFRGLDGRVTTATEQLASLQPAVELGMRFLGERIELTGLSLDPYGVARRTGTRLRLFWRFNDRVPSDLAALVTARDEDGHVFFRRSFQFGQELPQSFSAGEPRAGCLLWMDALLPPQAHAGAWLEISLRAENRRRSSDEGIPSLEIMNWTRYLGDRREWAP